MFNHLPNISSGTAHVLLQAASSVANGASIASLFIICSTPQLPKKLALLQAATRYNPSQENKNVSYVLFQASS